MHSFNRSSDGWWSVAVRLILGVATAAYVFHLSQTPGILEDIKDAAMRAHDDTRDYAISKIAFNFTNINERSLTHHIIDDDIDSPDNSTVTDGNVSNQTIQN